MKKVTHCSRQIFNHVAGVYRASMEGPLWCQVLQQFISGLEREMSEEDRATVLPDFIRWAMVGVVC